jgi:hypothetical protein
MIKKLNKNDLEALNALKAGIAEANRRNQGHFDGLLGLLPKGGSQLLQTLIVELRDTLLNRYTDEEARNLIAEYTPDRDKPRYRNVTTVPDDIELALNLLYLIASALKCNPEVRAKLFLGNRDAARQAGTQKKRNQHINDWIETKLKSNSSIKSKDLWELATHEVTDFVSYGRFAKRVSDTRKKIKLDANN